MLKVNITPLLTRGLPHRSYRLFRRDTTRRNAREFQEPQISLDVQFFPGVSRDGRANRLYFGRFQRCPGEASAELADQELRWYHLRRQHLRIGGPDLYADADQDPRALI